MLSGGEHCMSYEIVAEEMPNAECVGMGHNSAVATEYTSATPIAPHHFVYSSCTANEWVDFALYLSPSDYHYNYVIEAEDLTVTNGCKPLP